MRKMKDELSFVEDYVEGLPLSVTSNSHNDLHCLNILYEEESGKHMVNSDSGQ